MNSSSKRGGERDEKGRGDGVKEGWRGGWERRDGYWSKKREGKKIVLSFSIYNLYLD